MTKTSDASGLHDASNLAAGHGFGTTPVFLAAISTILGAIMFLRFGYAVGNVGVLGALAILAIGHLVTIPTALAVSELATNRKVEGGGEYYIISRSFGTVIGGAIGISLYLSQAISVAFYMIAFAEAVRPLAPYLLEYTGIPFDARLVSVPGVIVLGAVMLKKGADLGVKALIIVFLVLATSLVTFFAGSPVPDAAPAGLDLVASITNGDNFFTVFAIVFPALTGMTAGVGLSGDLRDPGRSIPLGTMLATVTGLVIYIAVVFKLAASATPERLAADQHVMAAISPWPPLILVGLACATLSSAIGSILVAPRTLQALAADRCFPSGILNDHLSAGVGDANEPRNATVVSIGIALVFCAAGNVDFVARIVSMFFMVTYGALCSISFLEHFAANPSYRPSFRSRWYVSLLGAVMCVFLMFQMDPGFAALSVLTMIALYRIVKRSQGSERDDVAAIFHGVMTQATRYLQVAIQRQGREIAGTHWRPSLVMIGARTFTRRAPRELMGWICQRHGFGTYLHHIRGPLDPDTAKEREDLRRRLVQLGERQGSGIFMDAIVSPSMQSALAQSLQVPGISGMDNNCVMFEVARDDGPEPFAEVAEMACFADLAGKNVLVLRSGENNFGDRADLHVWIDREDTDNANLMVLLAYIILGHRDWRWAEMSVFIAVPHDELANERARLRDVIRSGRIPVSEKNINVIAISDDDALSHEITTHSQNADLVVLGLPRLHAATPTAALHGFHQHAQLNDVLFVRANEAIRME